jgi:ethanolamine utilization protein EutN
VLLGRVTGTVTATAKDAALVGGALLLVDLPAGEIVALDTVGAGVGDEVIVTTGSAARLPGGATGAPVDATIIAIADSVARATK